MAIQRLAASLGQVSYICFDEGWVELAEPSVRLEARKYEADAQSLVHPVVRGISTVLNTLIHGLLRNSILK